MNKRMAIERRPPINICMYMCAAILSNVHARTRSIYNRSRSADLCICASYIMSFQYIYIYVHIIS